MKISENMVQKIVAEELEKFLEANPDFRKMMRTGAQAGAEASRDFKRNGVNAT